MISVQGTFVPTLVSSVFGRTGDVVAESGDYTPEQVGAAPAIHANRHATGGADPITPASIGAAADTHAAQHASTGSDPITPESIGAASAEELTQTSLGLQQEMGIIDDKVDGRVYRSGDEMTGTLVAAETAPGVAAVRNISAGTADLTPGVSALATGSIYFVYE